MYSSFYCLFWIVVTRTKWRSQHLHLNNTSKFYSALVYKGYFYFDFIIAGRSRLFTTELITPMDDNKRKNNGQLGKTKQREQTNKGIMIFLTFRHIECVDSTLAVTMQYTRITSHWHTQTTSMLRKLAEMKALCYATKKKTRRKSERE